MTTRPDPIQTATEDALALARQLLSLGHAALAWQDPDTGTPGISRIAFHRDPEAGLMTLVSGLAPHFRALRDRPDCALMLGEVGDKGDPLTHPRLMVR
ncbi:MAG: pyridoxamine 5-phosphate oxidase, partial [Tabrizicola sp.]